MTTLAELNGFVDDILQDKDAKLSTAQVNYFIQNSAVSQYSKHKPYIRTVDITAASTYDYSITTYLTSWIDGFSNVKNIEYPADVYQQPQIVPKEEWQIYEKTTGKFIRFLTTTPNSGTIRVWYSSPHSVPDSGAATVYPADESAFCQLAASFCASALANWYAEASDSTIGADAINYRDKSDIWNSRSKNNLQKYIEYMFPKNLFPAMSAREFDTIYSSLGYSRLTHPEWSR